MKNGVLFVNMPFSGADRPQIGISLLKSALRARQIPCDIRYFNLTLAEWLGPELYYWYSSEIDHTLFAGEWVFAQHFFGAELLDGQAYLRHLRARGVDERTIELILQVRPLIAPFLEHCLRSVDWSRYALIGFTSTFEQNLAALALARALKERYPDKLIVMGGANCEEPMGRALQRCFPFVDYVFSGEADYSFPEFVERLRQGRPVNDVPGLVYRQGRESIFSGPATSVTAMDTLPFPDYDDYFTQLAASPLAQRLTPMLQIETSRGCWWGAKHHCTFCGLNALSMNFRAKSKERALAEILHLVTRYQTRNLAAVDNILDAHYFRDLLPELKQRRLGLTLFYEVKANLSKEQTQLLSEAGVTMMQPGIESLHRNMLRLMRKGVAPLQNVQLLKWCVEFGIRPMWNLLYGFPGERAEDYQEMLPLLESITHLQPPDGYGSIRLDRFSPYFQDPAGFGLTNARPLETYRYVYPFPEAELAELAYFYQYDFADGRDPHSYIGPTLQQLGRWQAAAASGASLYARRLPQGELEITDTRPGALVRRVQLSEWHQELYEFCDQARSLTAIERWRHEHAPHVAPREAQEFLADLVNLRLMARDEDQFLSLAVALRRDERSTRFPRSLPRSRDAALLAA